jgi:hypothetical protein
MRLILHTGAYWLLLDLRAAAERPSVPRKNWPSDHVHHAGTPGQLHRPALERAAFEARYPIWWRFRSWLCLVKM